eukprot:snap_masked-scaffold898_size83862-processed-gene-0.1 protein:Tk12464 transcript:snap_masked-scaffold898_size83862-processed-gene-0.1-mRNA-1 annotation:"---NA---"
MGPCFNEFRMPGGRPVDFEIDLYDIKTVKRGNFNTVIMGHQAMIHHIYGPQPSPAAQTPARTLRIKRKARPPLPAGEAQPESPLVQPPPRKKRKPSNSSENQSQGPATSDPGSQDPIRMTGTSSEGSIKPPKSDPSHASESKSANNLQPPLKTVLHRDNSRVPQGPNAGQVESDSSTRDVRQASPTSVPSHQASKASLNRSKDLPAGHSSEQSRITTSKELPGPDEGNATRKSEKLPMDVLEGLSEESRQGREARRPGATNDFTERSSLKRGAPYAQVTKDQGSKPTKSSRDSSSRSQKEREEDEAATKQGNVDASQKSTRSSEVGKHQATRIPSSSSRGYSSKDNPRKEIVLRSVVVKPESNMVSSFETPPLSLIERVGSTKGAMDSPPVDNHDIKAPSNHSKSSSLSVASLHSQRSEKKKATFDLSEQQLAASSDFSELLDKVVGGASKCDRSAKMDQEPTKILKAELKRAKLSQDGSGNLAPNSGSGVSSRELAGRKPSGKEWEDSAEPSKVGKGGQLGVESTKIRANFKNIADESNRSSPTITSFSESSTENSKPDSLDGQKRTTRGSSQHSGGTGFLEMENRFPKDEKKLETRSYRTKLDAAKSFPKHTSKPSNASPDPSSRLPPISESGKPSPRTGSERSSQAEGDTRTGLLPHSNSDTNHQSSSPTETKTKANVAKDSIQDERSKRFESREKRLKLVSAKQSDAQTKDSSDGCKPKVPATEVDTVPNELANVEEGEIESESENEPIILRLKTSLKSSDVKQPKALCRELFGSDTESQDTFNPLHIEMDAEDRRGRSSPITKADVTDMNSTEIETLLEEKKTQYESLSKKADRYLRLLTSNSETNSPARETPASPEVDSPRPASEGDAPFEVDPSTFKPATPAAYAFSPLQNVPTYGSNRKTRIQRGRFDFTSPGGIASLLREVTDGAHLGHGNVIMTPQSGRSRSSSISSTAGGVSSAPTTGSKGLLPEGDKCFQSEGLLPEGDKCFQSEGLLPEGDKCFQSEGLLPEGDKCFQSEGLLPEGDKCFQS